MKWHNPFKVKDCNTVEEAILRFDAYLRASPPLIADLHQLLGKRLVCHCTLSRRCHADALARAVSEFVLNKPTVDCTISVGIYRDPIEFTLAAAELRHPFEPHALHPSLFDSITYRMTHSTDTVDRDRRSSLTSWKIALKSFDLAKSNFTPI